MTLRNAGGNLVDQIVLDRVKGVQLDPAAALNLALSNTAEALKEKHGNTLIRRPCAEPLWHDIVPYTTNPLIQTL